MTGREGGRERQREREERREGGRRGRSGKGVGEGEGEGGKSRRRVREKAEGGGWRGSGGLCIRHKTTTVAFHTWAGRSVQEVPGGRVGPALQPSPVHAYSNAALGERSRARLYVCIVGVGKPNARPKTIGVVGRFGKDATDDEKYPGNTQAHIKYAINVVKLEPAHNRFCFS